MNFKDKRIVVTGCSSGVGKETASLLTAAGAYVIGLDVRDSSGDCAEFIHCDLSDPASINDAVAQIKAPFHGLANVAGVPGSCTRDKVFKVNFLGLRLLTEKLLSKIADYGSVVNVASTAGTSWRNRRDLIKTVIATSDWDEGLAAFDKIEMDAIITYDFTKEVVILYTQLISSQERHRGVRVNSVSPGAIETPILKDFYDTMGADLLTSLKNQAGGRDAQPVEIARVILLMLQDEGYWINGTDLIVDGGAEVLMNLGEMAKRPVANIA
jgi:NAD(P)-dependent dehydrogenase (short-subunit alcohol dehydrogenase family)